MAKIISKLNLNRTPQLAEDYSLVYARNIKLTKDGAITRDDGVDKLFNMNDFETWISHHSNDSFYKDVAHFILNERYEGGGDGSNLGSLLELVGIIPDNNGFYAFYHFNTLDGNYASLSNKSFILFFNEKAEETESRISFVNCNWNWSGGDITGNVIKTLRGDIILNVAESPKDNNSEELVPFKSININKSSIEDNESIYTQTPNVPIINLKYLSKYPNLIPNGVYQFFIRYEIYEDFYTDWYPCSKELFAGTKQRLNSSIVGSMEYIDTNSNAGSSFVFEVDKIYDSNVEYKSFQLGFILSTDDQIVGRTWKSFALNTSIIYFDYDKEFISEIDVEDLLNTTYGIYNVKNVTSYKNKQYISNYKETDFNVASLENSANDIIIELKNASSQVEGNEFNVDINSHNFYVSVSGIKTNPVDVKDLCKDLFAQTINELYEILPNGNYPEELTFSNGPIDLDLILIEDDGHTTPFDANNFHEIRYDIAEVPIDDTDPESPTWEYDKDIYEYGVDGATTTIKNPSTEWSESLLDNVVFPNGIDSRTPDDPDATFRYNNFVVADENYFQDLYISNVGEYCLYVSFNNTGARYATYYCRFRLNVNPGAIVKEKDFTTLLPIQQYKFYVHYVKKTGEITNGYLVKKIDTGELDENNEPIYRNDGIVSFGDDISNDAVKNHNIIYPKFKNIIIPNGYVACFFTIQHYKHKVSELYNKMDLGSNDYYYDCMDFDTMLYYVNGKLDYVYFNQVIKYSEDLGDSIYAQYYPSFDNSNLLTFGHSGKVYVADIPDAGKGNPFVIMKYESNSKDLVLVKCTPYIKTATYDDFKNMNLLGYICNVVKPTVPNDTDNPSETEDLYYVNDGTIYTKDIDQSQKTMLFSANGIRTDSAFSSNKHTIYSNYNLNYISKRNDAYPVQTIKSLRTGSAGTMDGVVLYINSRELSTVYKLSSMYKDYTRKAYFTYDDDYLVKFDNTIRASIPFGDEDAIYTFKFRYDDYFNVPTNKGKIINLTSAGKAVLVHTEDSLFVFIGNNTFTGSGQDVTTKETDIFDTGLQEVFGTEKGYGGLRKKSNSIVTENAYVFYDADSKIIYAYSGEEKVINISASIDRLLHDFTIDNEVYKVSDIIFASDFYNDRLFVNIKYTNNKFITLTYSFISKGFISLHDINYDQSFSTKTKCYFTKKDDNHADHETLFEIVKNNSEYNNIVKQQDIYPELDVTYDNISVIDIILKLNYETIKVLDSISWICSKIIKEFSTDAPNEFNFAEESLDRYYAGNLLEVYTDTSYSGKLNLESKQNDSSIRDLNGYQKPRFNYGIWTLNYFRNIKNIDKNNPQSMGLVSSDNNSLIYGKYIVARFIFNRENNFKFENVIFNISNKQ